MQKDKKIQKRLQDVEISPQNPLTLKIPDISIQTNTKKPIQTPFQNEFRTFQTSSSPTNKGLKQSYSVQYIGLGKINEQRQGKIIHKTFDSSSRRNTFVKPQTSSSNRARTQLKIAKNKQDGSFIKALHNFELAVDTQIDETLENINNDYLIHQYARPRGLSIVHRNNSQDELQAKALNPKFLRLQKRFDNFKNKPIQIPVQRQGVMGWKLSRVVNQRIDYRPNTADFASKNSNLGKYRNILGQRLEDVPFINEAYLKMLYRNKNEQFVFQSFNKMGVSCSVCQKTQTHDDVQLQKVNNIRQSMTSNASISMIQNSKKISRRKLHNVNSKQACDTEIIEAPNATIKRRKQSPEEEKIIFACLSENFVFKSLLEQDIRFIMDQMICYVLDTLEIVVKQGDSANNLFVLVQGQLEVVVNGRRKKIIKQGESFGELALLHDTQRTATIRTLSRTLLWGLDRQSFRTAIQAVNANHYQENMNFIQSVSLFQGLTQEQMTNLLEAFVSNQFSNGYTICDENDIGDILYIVKEGSVVCTQKGVEVRRMTSGDYFGEQALLFNQKRTASVVAIGDVTCLTINQESLINVLGDHLQKIIYKNSIKFTIEKSLNLRRLQSDQINALVESFTVDQYEANQVVIPQGTCKSQSIWIVLKGKIQSADGSKVFDKFKLIGDQYLVDYNDRLYEYDYIAAETSHIAHLDIQKLEQVIGGAYHDVLLRNEIILIMKQIPIFRHIEDDKLHLLYQSLQLCKYLDNETIVQANVVGTNFYIIKSGQVNVFKDGIRLRTISMDDYFGERALLFDEVRSATVIADGPVECWVLEKEEFITYISEDMREMLMNRIGLQDDTVKLEDLVGVKLVGKGMFGTVFLVQHKEKQMQYALKTVSCDKILAYKLYSSLLLERRVMRHLDHPFIAKLVKSYKDDNRVYFLQEFINGMDLFDCLHKMGLLDDQSTKFYTASLVLIIEYLHERNIAYRDLKPENVIVDGQGFLRLIDFGTALFVQERTHTIVGTPNYMAPEIVTGKGYGLAVDYWSLGVMVFEFLYGIFPFGNDLDDPFAIYQAIVVGKLNFPDKIKSTESAKKIIELLLTKNPAIR